MAVHKVHDVAAVRLDPDQAVALGQALLHVLDVRLHILEDFLQIDIAPHALAVDAMEDHHLAGDVAALHLVHHVAVVVVAILGGLRRPVRQRCRVRRALARVGVGRGRGMAGQSLTLSPRSCWRDDALRLDA